MSRRTCIKRMIPSNQGANPTALPIDKLIYRDVYIRCIEKHRK